MLLRLSTRSCFEIRMQDEVTIYILLIIPEKTPKSSNIWEQPQHINILFRKKLTADRSQGMLAIIRCIIFCLKLAIKKFKGIHIHRNIIFPVVFMGVKIGRSH
jgi:hypothetical protein